MGSSLARLTELPPQMKTCAEMLGRGHSIRNTALKLGIQRVTIYGWRELPLFQDAVSAEQRTWTSELKQNQLRLIEMAQLVQEGVLAEPDSEKAQAQAHAIILRLMQLQ